MCFGCCDTISLVHRRLRTAKPSRTGSLAGRRSLCEHLRPAKRGEGDDDTKITAERKGRAISSGGIRQRYFMIEIMFQGFRQTINKIIKMRNNINVFAFTLAYVAP